MNLTYCNKNCHLHLQDHKHAVPTALPISLPSLSAVYLNGAQHSPHILTCPPAPPYFVLPTSSQLGPPSPQHAQPPLVRPIPRSQPPFSPSHSLRDTYTHIHTYTHACTLPLSHYPIPTVHPGDGAAPSTRSISSSRCSERRAFTQMRLRTYMYAPDLTVYVCLWRWKGSAGAVLLVPRSLGCGR